jgi:NADPH:quinone reductase-like Zn-dependent oxidoreductase
VAEMKAARYDKYGSPEVLYEGTVPVPAPKPGEVLVGVHAASVNGIDVIVRAGNLRLFTGRKFPRGTGDDFVGEVAVLTEGITGFHVGDRVWGVMPQNQLESVAEFLSIPAEQLALSPRNLDSVQAAALPVVGATTIIALCEIAQLKPGERLLIRGASGGVGSAAVQLGRKLGADVTALASLSSLDFVRQLGANRAFDYATTQPAELGSFDVILDAVGSNIAAYRRLLAPRGRMIAISPDPKRPLAFFIYLAVSMIYGTRRVRFFSAKPKSKEMAALTSYVESGAIRPIVDTVYPLSEIAAAHHALEKGGRRGKQIIRLS